jgi:hypothetical protein
MFSRSTSSSILLSILCLFVVVISVVYLSGCSDRDEFTSGPAASSQGDITLGKANPRVQSVMATQERYTVDLMADLNVVGTATGVTDDGEVVVKVFLKQGTAAGVRGRGVAANGVPLTLDGVKVLTEVTGEFKPMKGPPGGVSHTAIQGAPIQLGTSGGWRYDLANGYCCGGTLGALVEKNGTQYVLSNYHVFEADIVSGGNSRTAQAGDPVIQPGLIDVNCSASGAQNVATLSGIKSLPGSNVDAAIAQVISGMVDPNGSILEVGTISSSTIGASLNQAVKKSGRTTGLTRSKVTGLNATISVAYDNECAGGSAFTKTFTGQIVIDNKGNKFLNSGDSGSLMTEDADSNPRAVGLLYAGGATSAIANPINDVLSYLGATMVGQ